ncbi:MCP four helix bundle domain-containing protein [Pseudomonas sp. Fl5BN2]|uniref:MCP four helix bundle domain-containing protein n=1 Tax=Pseudomonas sp. Fl5BN2 TaxID=2697652 RepID=UPI003DA89F3C
MNVRAMNLAPRSAAFFSLIILVVLALGIVAVLQMGKLRDSEQDVETNWMASIREIGKMKTGVLRLRLESIRITVTTDEQQRQTRIASLSGYRSTLQNTISQYEPLITGPAERELYQAVADRCAGLFQAGGRVGAAAAQWRQRRGHCLDQYPYQPHDQRHAGEDGQTLGLQ